MKAEYFVIEKTHSVIFIADLNDGAMSVTNDAEAVVADIIKHHGNTRKIVYRDTENQFNELSVVNGVFSGFLPYTGFLPDVLCHDH